MMVVFVNGWVADFEGRVDGGLCKGVVCGTSILANLYWQISKSTSSHLLKTHRVTTQSYTSRPPNSLIVGNLV